ncbi:MAG: CYTH and CHAD domain-containing protein [Alphaproteobacteria bacterium]|nr:CYTH and CHAD domain-containing protein [Alphaproteobacteria bacterium]
MKRNSSIIDHTKRGLGADSKRVDVEIELKLSAAPEVLSALWESQCFSGPTTECRPRGRFDNIYYDTTKNRLHRRNISFRVRRAEGRFEQAVKFSEHQSGAIQDRLEWQWILPGPQPSLELITDPALREKLGPFRPGDLRPVFRTTYRRDTRRLTFNAQGSKPVSVEAALDIGEIQAGKRSLPIAEIELELIDGPPSAILDFALSLFDQVPVRVEPLSKSTRGYALAVGKAPVRTGGWVTDLNPDRPLDDAIEVILSKCFNHWLINETAAVDGTNTEGVHQVRVATRRMRSMLNVFRKVVSPDHALWLSSELKWLARGLGPARDWDVFLNDMLAPVLEDYENDDRLLRLKEIAERERRRAYDAWRRTVRSRDYAGLVLTLAAWLNRRGWNDGARGKTARLLAAPVRDYACDHLARRRKRLLKRGRHFETLTDRDLHRLRIGLKDLRSTIEFFGAVMPRRKFRRCRKSLISLQDQLGHLNDIRTLRSLTEKLQLACDDARELPDLVTASERVIGWHSRRTPDFRAEAAERWRGFGTEPLF